MTMHISAAVKDVEANYNTNRFVPHTGPVLEFLVCYRVRPPSKAMPLPGKLLPRLGQSRRALTCLEHSKHITKAFPVRLYDTTWIYLSRPANLYRSPADDAVQALHCGPLPGDAEEFFRRPRIPRPHPTIKKTTAHGFTI